MGLENRAPRPVKRVERQPQAPQPQAANNEEGWTAEEEEFFKVGEARTRAAETNAAREAEIKAYNAREAKIKAIKEGGQ